MSLNLIRKVQASTFHLLIFLFLTYLKKFISSSLLLIKLSLSEYFKLTKLLSEFFLFFFLIKGTFLEAQEQQKVIKSLLRLLILFKLYFETKIKFCIVSHTSFAVENFFPSILKN